MPIKQRADWEYTERQKLLMKGGGKKRIMARESGENKMTDDALNRFIDQNVMGMKWTDPGSNLENLRETCPNYCQDLNAAALAEAKVIEKIGRSAYGHKLAKQVGGELYYIEPTTEFFTDIATANARTRCEAMKLAMEDQK